MVCGGCWWPPFLRLLLWSREYRVQLGHMFEGWCVIPVWHVGHRLLES